MKPMRFFVFRVLPVLIIAVPIVLAFVLLEKRPAVFETKAPEVETAARARALAKKTIKGLLSGDETTLISATEDDLNGLMAFMTRGVGRLAGHVSIDSNGLAAVLTLRAPRNPIGGYVNLRIYLNPSESGLSINRVSIGRASISGSTALFIFRGVADLVLGNGQGTELANAVQSMTFHEKTVFAGFRPLPNLKDRLNILKGRLKGIRDTVDPLGDPDNVRVYYSKLMEIERQMNTRQPVSLSRFLGPLFEEARLRSVSRNPSEENRAAILALAMYAGDWRFERLIGKVRTEEMKSNRSYTKNIMLGGRRDLRLHFIISAGIKLVSDTGISHAIGEFKELLDAVRGGSGFSFADLAADRAGVCFAIAATDRSGGAARLQSVMAGNAKEDLFFPDVSALPEGISQRQFENRFGNVENKRYGALLKEIDRTIIQLPAYGGNKQGT